MGSLLSTGIEILPMQHKPICELVSCAYQEGHRLVIAEELRETLQEKLDMQLKTLASFPGSALEGCSYSHPLAGQEAALDRVSPVVIGGDYITTETGTGLVHTAPGHGLEDYHVRFSVQQWL